MSCNITWMNTTVTGNFSFVVSLVQKESLSNSFCHFAESLGNATVRSVPDGGAMARIVLCICPETIVFSVGHAAPSSNYICMALELAP